MEFSHMILLMGMGLAWLIAAEDFHERKIHLWLLVSLGMAGFAYNLLEQGTAFWINLLSNLVILTCIWLGVIIWFKTKGHEKVMDELLGWGDVLMLLSLAIWLPPQGFILMYVTTTFLAAISYSLLNYFNKISEDHPVPLAGWLGLASIIFFPLFIL